MKGNQKDQLEQHRDPTPRKKLKLDTESKKELIENLEYITAFGNQLKNSFQRHKDSCNDEKIGSHVDEENKNKVSNTPSHVNEENILSNKLFHLEDQKLYYKDWKAMYAENSSALPIANGRNFDYLFTWPKKTPYVRTFSENNDEWKFEVDSLYRGGICQQFSAEKIENKAWDEEYGDGLNNEFISKSDNYSHQIDLNENPCKLEDIIYQCWNRASHVASSCLSYDQVWKTRKEKHGHDSTLTRNKISSRYGSQVHLNVSNDSRHKRETMHRTTKQTDPMLYQSREKMHKLMTDILREEALFVVDTILCLLLTKSKECSHVDVGSKDEKFNWLDVISILKSYEDDVRTKQQISSQETVQKSLESIQMDENSTPIPLNKDIIKTLELRLIHRYGNVQALENQRSKTH